MSCVTVKVPWAPQPLACMRRSGITSRSKCASFSISQISWSSAGPRRPAVMMLVLSATGAPVAFVNVLVLPFLLDMISPLLCWIRWRVAASACWLADGSLSAVFSRTGLVGSSATGGSSNNAAEIDAGEVRILVREHVGVDVAEGRLRLVLVAVVEGLDDVFFETRATRMCMH